MYGRNLLVAHTMARHSLSWWNNSFRLPFVRVLAYAITSRHYSEFVLGTAPIPYRLHQYGISVEALSSYIPNNTGSEVKVSFLKISKNASTSSDPNETPRHFSATTAKVRRDNRNL
ncbi:hypothetical protein TNCV_4497061 [Trichonephila clavipes]|nr:hypothetical protein TNCV_4497061 [Trichonephila clavipes]